MLTREVLLQLQKYNFDLLAHQEPSGRRRLRYMALAHIQNGKTPAETALALRMTPSAVTHLLIPIPSHDIPRAEVRFAQLRVHSERIAFGIWVNLFHASQQASMMSS